MKCSLIFPVIIFMAGLLSAQSFEHRKFKYDWKDEIKVDLFQSEKYKKYPAVILYEETYIDVIEGSIKRYQVIQFNDSASIRDYNYFRVPLPMEPYKDQTLNQYYPDSTAFPKLSYDKINFFDARINRDSQYVKAILKEHAHMQQERVGEYLIPFYVHDFYVRNLQPGDKLEVMISHMWPLGTGKYFLNEKLPKQEAYITIRNTYLGEIFTSFPSGVCRPISQETNGKGFYQVVVEDINPVDPALPAPLDQVPYIGFYQDKISQRSTKLFGEDVIDTLEWKDYNFLFVNRIYPTEVRTWEGLDRQSYKTNDFFDRMKQSAPDTLDGAKLMTYIHTYATNNLGYKNDFKYFIKEEGGFENLGSWLEKGILREASRYNFYYQMLDRINRPYYKVFLQDKRYAFIDPARPGVLSLDNMAYVIFDKDSNLCTFLPKSHQFGWYTNELPFYLTGGSTYLIPQMVSRYMYDREPDNIPYPFYNYTDYPKSANNRNTKTTIRIDTEKDRSSLESDISLEGQFSTMVRGYYLYNWKDTSVNPLYYQDFFQEGRPGKTEMREHSEEFPFIHRFYRKGEDLKNIFHTLDSSLVIDLSHLINIPYHELDTKYFQTGFMHDFQGKDDFTLELYFDKPVEIVSPELYDLDIVAPGFTLKAGLVKNTGDHWDLHITWDISEDVTPVENLPMLEKAMKAIRKLSLMKLEFRLV